MYEVYGAVSNRSFRVVWLLEEMGLEFVLHSINPRSPEAMAVNPSGKVPVLKVGDDMITDSAAIMTYLADKHGQFTYPAGTVERAKQDALMHQVLDELDAVLWTAARHGFILPEDKRVPAVKPSLAWEFKRNAQRIADKIEGPFLMGEQMTIPDFLLVHCLNWAVSAKFEHGSDKLDAYASAVRAREAFKATRERAKA